MINELKIRKGVFTVFSLLWMSIIFFDYMDKHPIYWLSIVEFKYHTWFIVNIMVGVSLSLYVKRIGIFSTSF